MSVAASIHTAIDTIVTRLASANGAGDYNYDLSAAGRIHRGEPLDGPQESPEVWVGNPELTEATEVAVFGRTRYRVSIPIVCFLAATDSERVPLCANLASDVKRALTTTDRTLGNLGFALNVRAASIRDGRSDGFDAHAIADLDVSFVLDVDEEQL